MGAKPVKVIGFDSVREYTPEQINNGEAPEQITLDHINSQEGRPPPRASEQARIAHVAAPLDTELVQEMVAKGFVEPPTGTPNAPSHMSAFVWDIRSEKAAYMCADGTYKPSDIAHFIGVPVTVLNNWRNHPGFKSRVYDLITAVGDAVAGHVLATKEGRARRAIQIAGDLAQIQFDRATSASEEAYADPETAPKFDFDPELAAIPGGATGLLTRHTKVIGTGDSAEKITEFRLDVGIINAEKDLLKYTAEELGQWSTKVQTDVTVKRYLGIDIDLL